MERCRYESEDKLTTSRLMDEKLKSIISKAAANASKARTSIMMKMFHIFSKNN